MRNNREIPIELVCTILVLFPKDNTDTQGIGLLETLCKVVEAIIYTHLREIISFHDVLCGFHAGRGTGTAILDIKLAQEIASIDQDPLLLVFMYL